MKRFISVVLLVVMILTVCATAFADEGPFSTSLLKKDKAAQSGTLQKSTKTGSAASVTVEGMTDKNGTYATFHFRVWRSSTYQASNGTRITGKGSASLTTLKDDYGNSRLRQGSNYSYFLKATHSTYSKLSEAKCNGSWHP